MTKNGMSGVTKIILLLVIITVIPLTNAFPGDNKNDETKQVQLDDVAVTATRSEKEILDVPQHVTVIIEKDIKKSFCFPGENKSYIPQPAIKGTDDEKATDPDILSLIDTQKAQY